MTHIWIIFLLMPLPLLCRNGVLQHFNSQHHGGIILEKGDAEALLVWANE